MRDIRKEIIEKKEQAKKENEAFLESCKKELDEILKEIAPALDDIADLAVEFKSNFAYYGAGVSLEIEYGSVDIFLHRMNCGMKYVPYESYWFYKERDSRPELKEQHKDSLTGLKEQHKIAVIAKEFLSSEKENMIDAMKEAVVADEAKINKEVSSFYEIN